MRVHAVMEPAVAEAQDFRAGRLVARGAEGLVPRDGQGGAPVGRPPRNPILGAWWVWPAVLLAGVYGGYFGAAQGVLLMGIMGVGIPETLQRLNGLKNVLAAIVNGVAGLLFAIVAHPDWRIVALIGVGSVIGGQLGATVGRRLPAPVLRGVIVVVGVVALLVFLLG